MKKRFFGFVLGASLVLSSFNISYAKPEAQVSRIYGSSRYQTAVNVSKTYYEKSDTVLVASGEGFADALVGGTLSSQIDAPLLLTNSATLTKEVKSEIKRLQAKKIYLLGGKGTVTKAVEDELKTLASVTRLFGKNRFETAKAIGKERLALAKTEDYHTAAVNGFEYPDALASAPFIGQFGNEKTKTTLLLPHEKDMKPNYIIGGEGSVDYKGEVIKRFKGTDRVKTSLEIANNYEDYLGIKPNALIVVNGDDYPDALAAVSASKVLKAPIILNRGKHVSEDLSRYLDKNEIEKIVIIGGEGSVPDSVFKELVDGKPYTPPTIIPTEEPTKPTDGQRPTETGVPMDLDKLWVDKNGNGLIKGNISTKGEKIYHVPGQNAYDRTRINPSKGERWFKTEREAQKAGWRRAEK
ncbi:cell wall-binding repeat-containing protein [Lagierella sp.]|uniref:cell wall-binding repeat-containing protein n=1 Tax=Lagierella sp. TaxID=2849657 RepID=UPI00262C008F|nr:cell wall-binding repeat-containing protein [Lagierella sp.]